MNEQKFEINYQNPLEECFKKKEIILYRKRYWRIRGRSVH